MRYYKFQVRDGNITATLAAELDALTMFPEDEASIRQARSLFHDEHLRLKKLGAKDFVPSELTQVVMRAFDRQMTQRATCALVALAMVGLDDIGDTMSLRRSAAVVSEYSNSNHGSKFFRRIEGGLDISSKALTGDPKSIENIFRKYRSVAHILAARAARSDHDRPTGSWSGTSSSDQCFLSTVLYFQKRLSKARNFDDWNLWQIDTDPSSAAAQMPKPWLPKRDTMRKLLEPWISAGKPVSD